MTGRPELSAVECPVGRGVDVVGEAWALLIVRDALHGITRFDDLRQHLGISPTTLTQRLRRLVDVGVLRRHRYQDRPPRHEYLLTDRGRELAAVVLALGGWWNDGVEPGRRPVVVVDSVTGEEAEPIVVDRRTGLPIEWPRHRFAAGPTASERVRALIAANDPQRGVS